MAKTCQRTNCDRGTYGEFCLMHRPRKPIQTKTPLPRATKPIKQKAKQGMMWEATRLRWYKENPAPYNCHYCGKFLPKKQTTLDHKVPRSRAPELRHEFSNLVPCCYSCNSLKGSVAHDDYAHICH